MTKLLYSYSMNATGTLLQRARRVYRKLFSIEEFERSDVLPWVFGVLLVGFLMLANTLIDTDTITIQGVLNNSSVCWPWFPNCDSWHFLVGYPDGYSQRLAFALVLGILVGCVYSIWKKDWTTAHALLMIVYLFFIFLVYVMEGRSGLRYGDHLVVLTTVVLFFRNKVFYLGFTLVLLYFFGGLSKLNEGWLTGSRFLWSDSGLPLIPRGATMFATNVIVVMELLGSWLLLAKSSAMRISVLCFFIIFHIYTIIFTGFTYSVVALPLLLLLFSQERRERMPDRLQVGASLFLGTLFVLQITHFFIPGDMRITREGGMYAFDSFSSSNECRSYVTHVYRDGTTREWVRKGNGGCDPYAQLSRIQRECEFATPKPVRIAWKFDQSVNGEPYLRIVDVPNACVLTYNAFLHNEWIRLDPEIRKQPEQK